MKRNLVLQLMRSNPDDWDSILENQFKIKITRDGDLASLKYDQLESPMHEPIVQQCRGMVVDCHKRTVLAWPYDKFWNLGDTGAAEIDWKTARVLEKLDGSLMILYWNDPQWCVASSGTPRASGSFGSADKDFRTAFWETFDRLNYKLPPPEWNDFTFMFELCDDPNRVVVKYDKPRLVLHGARAVRNVSWVSGGGSWEYDLNGDELPRDDQEYICERLDWELVREFPISIEECLDAAEFLNPVEQEGFIVVDDAFNRVKIKSPRYVALHHMKGEATPRRAIDLWRRGEISELLLHFPEMAEVITPVQDQLESVALQAVKDFEENMPRASRKEFAMAVKDKPWAAVLFKMLSEGSTLLDVYAIMRRMPIAALERMISV